MWWGTRGDALLGLLLVNREGLMSDVMPGGCLGHSSHKMITVFDSQRSKELGQQKLQAWTSGGQTLP